MFYCSKINVYVASLCRICQHFFIRRPSTHQPSKKCVTRPRILMLQVKARSWNACTTRLACLRSRICFYLPSDVPEELIAQPPLVFLRFFLEDRTSAPDVFISCSFILCILRQVQKWSVSVVTRYDVISNRCQGLFWVKIHVFCSPFFNKKSKSCSQNHAKCLFMCYFSYQLQKNTISHGSNLILNFGQNSRWRPLLVTSQASNSATTHEIHLILLRRSKPFNWR